MRNNWTWSATEALIFHLDEQIIENNSTYCLTFWYHMFGKYSGIITVRTGNDPSSRGGKTIFIRNGNLQNKWYKAEVQRVGDADNKVIF